MESVYIINVDTVRERPTVTWENSKYGERGCEFAGTGVCMDSV